MSLEELSGEITEVCVMSLEVVVRRNNRSLRIKVKK